MVAETTGATDPGQGGRMSRQRKRPTDTASDCESAAAGCASTSSPSSTTPR